MQGENSSYYSTTLAVLLGSRWLHPRTWALTLISSYSRAGIFSIQQSCQHQLFSAIKVLLKANTKEWIRDFLFSLSPMGNSTSSNKARQGYWVKITCSSFLVEWRFYVRKNNNQVIFILSYSPFIDHGYLLGYIFVNDGDVLIRIETNCCSVASPYKSHLQQILEILKHILHVKTNTFLVTRR